MVTRQVHKPIRYWKNSTGKGRTWSGFKGIATDLPLLAVWSLSNVIKDECIVQLKHVRKHQEDEDEGEATRHPRHVAICCRRQGRNGKGKVKYSNETGLASIITTKERSRLNLLRVKFGRFPFTSFWMQSCLYLSKCASRFMENRLNAQHKPCKMTRLSIQLSIGRLLWNPRSTPCLSDLWRHLETFEMS